jgi:hypothetical protein
VEPEYHRSWDDRPSGPAAAQARRRVPWRARPWGARSSGAPVSGSPASASGVTAATRPSGAQARHRCRAAEPQGPSRPRPRRACAAACSSPGRSSVRRLPRRHTQERSFQAPPDHSAPTPRCLPEEIAKASARPSHPGKPQGARRAPA